MFSINSVYLKCLLFTWGCEPCHWPYQQMSLYVIIIIICHHFHYLFSHDSFPFVVTRHSFTITCTVKNILHQFLYIILILCVCVCSIVFGTAKFLPEIPCRLDPFSCTLGNVEKGMNLLRAYGNNQETLWEASSLSHRTQHSPCCDMS